MAATCRRLALTGSELGDYLLVPPLPRLTIALLPAGRHGTTTLGVACKQVHGE